MSALFIQLMTMKQRNASGADSSELLDFPDMSIEDLLTTSEYPEWSRSTKFYHCLQHRTERDQLVTTEEAVIVGIVLVIWVGVILLFVRKWGKIRGLEPYTPTFDRNASFSIPPPIPLSSVMKKTCSESRDTLASNSHKVKPGDSQSERLMLTIPGHISSRSRTCFSSPDVRFTHSRRTLPLQRLPRLSERPSEDKESVEQNTESEIQEIV